MRDCISVRLRKQLMNQDGSSMISVLVAFIILLLGIAGFSHAVTTANDMVRRAEMLNVATGKVLGEYFYPYYASMTSYENIDEEFRKNNPPLEVYEEVETGSSMSAFSIPGYHYIKDYTVTVTDESGNEMNLTYNMHFYK